MKENYTHMIVILDQSGSMSSIQSDMEGGFNTFIEDQKKIDGKATLTLTKFSSHHDIEKVNEDIKSFDELVLYPEGMTALYDAIGHTLESERERLKSLDEDEKPSKIVCVVITDGGENSSRKYDQKQAFEMIEDLKAESPAWDFVFMGANQDSFESGGSLGVRKGATMDYMATSDGTKMALNSLSQSMTCFRASSIGTQYSFNNEGDSEDLAVFGDSD